MGTSREGEPVGKGKVTKLLAARGTTTIELDEATAGDVVSIAGLGVASVTDTLLGSDPKASGMRPIETHPIDPPTISMTFAVNSSPMAGREGEKLNGQMLEARLFKETENNVSIS